MGWDACTSGQGVIRAWVPLAARHHRCEAQQLSLSKQACCIGKVPRQQQRNQDESCNAAMPGPRSSQPWRPSQPRAAAQCSRLLGVAAGAGVCAGLVALAARDQDAHVVGQRLLLGARGAGGVGDGQGGLTGGGAAHGGRTARRRAAAAGGDQGLRGSGQASRAVRGPSQAGPLDEAGSGPSQVAAPRASVHPGVLPPPGRGRTLRKGMQAL